VCVVLCVVSLSLSLPVSVCLSVTVTVTVSVFISVVCGGGGAVEIKAAPRQRCVWCLSRQPNCWCRVY